MNRQFGLAKSLFLQALDRPAEQRPEFLQRECAGQPELLAEVQGLLEFHEQALAMLDLEPIEETPPDRVSEHEILGVLGRGGMGVVYLARREGEAPVALKVLRKGLLTPGLLARFRREATVLSRLDHPGIARFVASGIEVGPGGAIPWLSMQRIDGRDLRAWSLEPHHPQEKLELMARVCDAVEHAHRQGVVHRDLKPENLLVQPDGAPVVLDFGVARLAESDLRVTTVMTRAGMLIGTIRYMSPEQVDARAEAIGPPSDVYALGVLIYELLTGRLPYRIPEDSVHRALVAVLTAPPLPMGELPARLRRPLERVLRAALAKDPAQRTPSAAALARDLRRVAQGRRPLARVPLARAPGWGRLAALWPALVSVGAIAGLVAGLSRQDPTPLERIEGLVRPGLVLRRVCALGDSALARVHYNTRTLESERQARRELERALALLSTAGGSPWEPELGKLLRFRLGEVLYLIAERTYDPRLYALAGETWYSAREPEPVRRVPLPGVGGATAGSALLTRGTSAWGGAAMAFTDAGRLADAAGFAARARAVRLEGVHELLRGFRARSIEQVALPQDRDSCLLLAGWLQGLGQGELALAEHREEPGLARLALAHLRRAASIRVVWMEPASYASVLHDLGAAFLWSSVLGHADSLADSARVALDHARRLRSELPGYTSVVFSARALANTERLAARAARTNAARRRHLLAALAALEPPPADLVPLGPLDQAQLDLGRAATLVDLACAERDTALLSRALECAWAARREYAGGRTPLPLAEAMLQILRVEGQQLATSGHEIHRLRARQLIQQCSSLSGAYNSPHLQRLLGQAATELGNKFPRAWDPTYPLSDPF